MKIYLVLGASQSQASIINPGMIAAKGAGHPEVLLTFAGYPKLFDSLEVLINRTETYAYLPRPIGSRA